MNSWNNMHPTNKAARVAGLVYLMLVATAPLRLVYIPSTLFVKGDAAATAANITAHETLFRLGIAFDILTGVIMLGVVYSLYLLFRDADRKIATFMVVLGGLMVTPIYFVNTINDGAVLQLLGDNEFLSVFTQQQRESLALLFLRLHHQGVLANQVFWGLWLFPFGALVIKSGFLPRLLGFWLFLGGAGYIAVSFTAFLWPHYVDIVSTLTFPGMLSEVAIVLWLLIMGAKIRPPLPVAVAA